ncbi:class I SAM-dependent methyltransferase [Cohnella silvisoli]|uniref:Class I SAM-dependent methyltransferase n=1 Tax=Cohnella silvisoli TaxID=2873699 RepID=A0ABV1KMU2_9BACL|nr:class I SAM-dependent methyltransferase [Cohnella silvisoli]MCD9020273.1 class I SAM-dependent methyltransferase [Cohnella silvisoli]
MHDEKNRIRQAYNNYAEQRDLAQMEPWKFKERQRFLQSILEEDLNSILELGAGTGRDSLYFQQNRFDVVCVDLSDEMVKLCMEKGLDARRMDFYQLDFEPEQFDSAYAMNSLLHVPKSDIDQVLEQIHRVLKPGGLFFFGVYGGVSSEGVWDKDPYEPQRFFSMYTDEEIVEVAKRWFEVEDFHIEPMEDGTLHFQSLLLRK